MAHLHPLTSSMPMRAGIGLRGAHYESLLTQKPALGFLEIHAENYFGGGYHCHMLDQCVDHYPISIHGVGMSLGSSEPIDAAHLQAFKQLVHRYNPIFISEHAAWSKSGNTHMGDLLPLPYMPESLGALCANIDRMQQALGRILLIENPSTYLTFAESTMHEADFLAEAAKRTGCGILLDVNNIIVQQHNNGLDAMDYMSRLPLESVGEVHLAGHIAQQCGGEILLIDTHSQPVGDAAWGIYEILLEKVGARPTLIEWDQNIPVLEVLLEQADIANTIMQKVSRHELV